MGFGEFSGRLLKNTGFIRSLAAINFIGFLYGIYYYWNQLSSTPAYLWIFVIDSPLPVLLFVLVAYFIYSSKKVPQWLLFLAVVGLIKYGFWTSLVIVLFWDYFFGFAPFIYAINLPLHLGMIAEGVILLRMLKPQASDLMVVFSFFIANDVLDYLLGTLPVMPNTYNAYLAIESFAVSILLPLWIYRRGRQPSSKMHTAIPSPRMRKGNPPHARTDVLHHWFLSIFSNMSAMRLPLLLALALIAAGCVQQPAPVPIEGGKEFRMAIFHTAYSPDRLEVDKGDIVRILAVSGPGTASHNHGITIDEYGINVTVATEDTSNPVKIEFVADREGNFTMHCEPCKAGPFGAAHPDIGAMLVVK